MEGEAPDDVTLYKGFSADAVKVTGEGVVEFTISTGAVDREGDTIDPKGWELDNYRKNPVVLWAHMHSMLPVGRAPEVKVDGKRLKAAIEYTPDGEVPFNDTVRRLTLAGYLKATSVGFNPFEWEPSQDEDRKGPFGPGFDFKRHELLEFSQVPVPANPEALIEAKSNGFDLAPIVAWAEKTLDEWTGEDYARLRFSRQHLERAYWAMGDTKALILDFGVNGHGPEAIEAKGVEVEDALPETDQKLTAEQGDVISKLAARVDELTEKLAALEGEPNDPPNDPPADPDKGADESVLDRIERDFEALHASTRSEPEDPIDVLLRNPETTREILAGVIGEKVNAEIDRARGKLPD